MQSCFSGVFLLHLIGIPLLCFDLARAKASDNRVFNAHADVVDRSDERRISSRVTWCKMLHQLAQCVKTFQSIEYGVGYTCWVYSATASFKSDMFTYTLGLKVKGYNCKLSCRPTENRRKNSCKWNVYF